MSNPIEAFVEAKKALIKEREQLVRRIAEIDEVLGATPASNPSGQRQKRTRMKGSVSAAIAQILRDSKDGLTVKDIRAKLPTIKPATINATLSNRKGKDWGHKGKLWVSLV